MDTTAIIRSYDTKYREIAYTRGQVESQGMRAMVVSVTTGSNPSYGYNASREDATRAAGTEWAELEPRAKGEKIAFMMEAVAPYVGKLYAEGGIDGIPSAGGLQNTAMAINVTKRLPMGFPKIMATTVVSGHKAFESVVRVKDIVTIPSICGFTGLNIVTRQIMTGTCACCAGVVKHAGQVLEKGDKPVVGVALVGITSIGARAAIDELKRLGIELIGFHSTGAGKIIMEQMVTDGLIGGILDLATHGITQEYFKGDFSYREDTKYRLVRGVEKEMSLVANVNGLDSTDFQTGEFPPRVDKRIYMIRNANTVHIKLLPDEAEITTARFATRIERTNYPVKLPTPTDGVYHNTRKGEALYHKEADDIIIRQLKKIRNPNVEIIIISGNLSTEEWGVQAARHVVDELKEHAVIGDEVQY